MFYWCIISLLLAISFVDNVESFVDVNDSVTAELLTSTQEPLPEVASTKMPHVTEKVDTVAPTMYKIKPTEEIITPSSTLGLEVARDEVKKPEPAEVVTEKLLEPEEAPTQKIPVPMMRLANIELDEKTCGCNNLTKSRKQVPYECVSVCVRVAGSQQKTTENNMLFGLPTWLSSLIFGVTGAVILLLLVIALSNWHRRRRLRQRLVSLHQDLEMAPTQHQNETNANAAILDGIGGRQNHRESAGDRRRGSVANSSGAARAPRGSRRLCRGTRVAKRCRARNARDKAHHVDI